MKSINWIGVIAAVVVSQIIGFVWYGVVFEQQWLALSGVDPSAGSNLAMALGVVQTAVVAVGLGWMTVRTGAAGWVGGAVQAFWICLFFALATMALRFIYGDDNTGLIPIDGGYMLVQYVVSGALIGGLRLGKAAPAA
ncbi:MAG: DUF1761 domain-containing protein [Caulobacter sp.]|nr:DUF1761 domain-containing protein [Caulobacter sp.]